MRLFLALFGSVLVVASSAIASAGTIDRKLPEPVSRPAPSIGLYYYCIDPDNVPEDGHIGAVTVGYDLTRWGRAENIEIISSTNECLELSARIIARAWVYDSDSVRRARRKDRYVETTLEYHVTDELIEQIRILLASEVGLDRDAQPMLRIPPQPVQFQHCIRSARFKIERVLLEFDVTIEGEAINVKTIDSTNGCYNKAAVSAVKTWIYGPKIVDRQPVPRKGVRTTIEFQVGGD